jgi:S1-C subfamily serine protease
LAAGRLDLDVEGADLNAVGRTVVAAVALAAVGCAPDPPSAIVGVVVEGCPPGLDTGSGAIIADDVVITSAHTLRGAETITVTRGDDEVGATIVAFDPELDLALLTVDLPGRPLDVDSTGVDPGDRGRAWVVRNGDPTPVDVVVERRIELRTEDIYVEGETVRPGLELTAEIELGDSGGVVMVDDKVVGVVWARSRQQPGRAYAIDPDRGGGRIEEQLRTGDLGPVDLTRC